MLAPLPTERGKTGPKGKVWHQVFNCTDTKVLRVMGSLPWLFHAEAAPSYSSQVLGSWLFVYLWQTPATAQRHDSTRFKVSSHLKEAEGGRRCDTCPTLTPRSSRR